MKITNAMYMISSSKLTQAKETGGYGALFTGPGRNFRILRHMPEMAQHPFFDAREEIPAEKRKIGSIVVSADKDWPVPTTTISSSWSEELLKTPGEHKAVRGGRAGEYIISPDQVEVDTHFQYTVQKPTMHRARDIGGKIIEQFLEGRAG